MGLKQQIIIASSEKIMISSTPMPMPKTIPELELSAVVVETVVVSAKVK
jgi:hypothetical protein